MNSALQSIEAIAPLLQQQQQAPGRTSLLPQLVHSLHQHQLFRSLLPQTLGGSEQSLPDFLQALAACGAIDASTAWCLNQGAVAASLSCWLPAATAQQIWQDPNAAIASGAPVDGTARWQGDSLMVTGRWMFCSGYHHATHIAGAVKSADEPSWVMVFVPKSQVQVNDNWQTHGLRATGSVEFSLTECAVPKTYVASMQQPADLAPPLFRLPTGQCFALGFAALALGVATAALQDCVELAQHKRPRNSRGGLNQDQDAQQAMGLAQARLQAAQLLLQHNSAQAWQAADACPTGELVPESIRVNLRLAGTHGLREAAAVMQLAWQIAGTSGIYQDHPLHQRHQDMAVISQHAQARVSHYAWLGHYLFGGSYQAGPLN